MRVQQMLMRRVELHAFGCHGEGSVEGFAQLPGMTARHGASADKGVACGRIGREPQSSPLRCRHADALDLPFEIDA
jgi:hypothetical protein